MKKLLAIKSACLSLVLTSTILFCIKAEACGIDQPFTATDTSCFGGAYEYFYKSQCLTSENNSVAQFTGLIIDMSYECSEPGAYASYSVGGQQNGSNTAYWVIQDGGCLYLSELRGY